MLGGSLLSELPSSFVWTAGRFAEVDGLLVMYMYLCCYLCFVCEAYDVILLTWGQPPSKGELMWDMYTVSQRAIEVIMVKCFHLCMNWNYLPGLYGVCCDIVFTVAITNNANNIDPIMCLSSSRILKIVGFTFWIWRNTFKVGYYSSISVWVINALSSKNVNNEGL